MPELLRRSAAAHRHDRLAVCACILASLGPEATSGIALLTPVLAWGAALGAIVGVVAWAKDGRAHRRAGVAAEHGYVKAVPGHATASMTFHLYSHLRDDSLPRAADLMARSWPGRSRTPAHRRQRTAASPSDLRFCNGRGDRI